MVDTNNINITVSLSDDTLEKLAAIFSQANENFAWDPNPKVIDSPTHEAMRKASVGREVVVEQEPVQAQETGEDIYAGQCGLVFELATQELRKSKAKRIDNKKNHRIGEAYWCRKPKDHTGKHVEGFPPENQSLAPAQATEEPVEPVEPDERPMGRFMPEEPVEPAEQSTVLEPLDGYENDSKCGWWQDGNKAKFCELEPEHSGTCKWQNPAPVMQVSAIWSPKERVWRSGE